jgi:hypothetical protein
VATWEQRRRGILRTALELERDLFAAENRYIADLRASLEEVQAELNARMARMNLQPREDGNFDWERWQTEALLDELERSMTYWEQRATSVVQSGTTAADEMGGQYPVDILSAGGSDMRVRPRLGNPALAAFHAYDAGLVKGVSDKARNDITGLIRRASLGGDSLFSVLQRIGAVTGKGAFATAFHRGEAIIRTEMGRAYSSADMWTMRQSALDHPGLKKKWLSIIDGRSRPEHAAAHDQVRELDKPFDVGGENLQHPHDTNGSAWNTINCRCKAVPWDPAWEKLPKPGVAAELGPLTMGDRAGFDARMRELNDIAARYQQFLPNTPSSATRRRDISAREQQEEHTWPTPRNPAYWRSKPGFTLDELRAIALSQGPFRAFLSERYGIRYGMEWESNQGTYPGDIKTLDAASRLAFLRALETYRDLDPSLVVENLSLRWITNTSLLPRDVMAEMSYGGVLAVNAGRLSDFFGRNRDPDGKNLPRLSDDAALEVAMHEIAHAIAARYGSEAGAGMTWITEKPLGQTAWEEWWSIHNTSAGIGQQMARIEEARVRQVAELQQEIEAKRRLGYTDDDLEARLQMLEYLSTPLDPTVNEPFPSSYASSGGWAEDFAESLTLALMQPVEFRTTHPQRYAWFQKYMPRLMP